MKRVGEDPDKPLRESAAGMEIDDEELRTYDEGNPKEESQAFERTAGDRDDRDWGAWKPKGRSKAVAKVDENKDRKVISVGGQSLGEIHPSEPFFRKYKMHQLHPNYKTVYIGQKCLYLRTAYNVGHL